PRSCQERGLRSPAEPCHCQPRAPARCATYVARGYGVEGMRVDSSGSALLESRKPRPDLMSSSLDPGESLRNPDVLDRLAEIEHERWAHWQRYVHASCRKEA